MKLIFSILFTVVIGITCTAQTYAGLRGQIANTWMFNKNLSDNGDLVDYKGTYKGSGGVSFIHLFSASSGLELGIGKSAIAQRTQGEWESFGGDKETYVLETSVKYTELSLLYKLKTEGGFYLEAGPMFMLSGTGSEELLEVSDADLGELVFGDQEDLDSRIEDDFSNSIVMGVLGLGGSFDLSDELSMSVGVRFGFGLSDPVNEISEDEYLDPDGPELSWYSGIAHTEAPVESGEYGPTNTSSAFAGLNIGLYYLIGGN